MYATDTNATETSATAIPAFGMVNSSAPNGPATARPVS